MDKLILTLDLGTTAVKLSLFKTDLSLVNSVTEEYTVTALADGRVEINPTTWTNAIERGILRLHGKDKPLGEIVAISTTTQGETLIAVDKHGKPLYPAIVWLDNRATDQANYLLRNFTNEEFYSTTGIPEISGSVPVAKMMWFRDEMPEIYDKTFCFLLAEDYILHWLTGEFVTEKSLQSSTGWFDIQNDCIWDKMVSVANLNLKKFPKLLSCGAFVGKVVKERVYELKLGYSCIAVTAAMDQVAAAFGAGCNVEGIIVETTGTALVMAAFTSKPDFKKAAGTTVYRHAIDGAYLYLPIGNTAGIALKWFRDNFCENDGYDKLDKLAACVSPTSDGLLFLPYLAGCAGQDNLPNAKAAFWGATLATSKGHFIRAIMEAIGYQLKEFIEVLENIGVTANEVHSLGGGAKSEVWGQIKADCCNTTFVVSQNSEAASLGAAALALKGLKLPQEHLENSDKSVFAPDEDACIAYENGYKEFVRLREILAPLHK